MAAALQVLVAEQGDELRVLDVVAPGEGDQLVERLDRPARVEGERALGLAELAVDALEHLQVERFLAARSSSRSSGRSTRRARDALDAGTAVAVMHELVARRAQDAPLGLDGVAGGGHRGGGSSRQALQIGAAMLD